jgi:hypothetical protein
VIAGIVSKNRKMRQAKASTSEAAQATRSTNVDSDFLRKLTMLVDFVIFVVPHVNFSDFRF